MTDQHHTGGHRDSSAGERSATRVMLYEASSATGANASGGKGLLAVYEHASGTMRVVVEPLGEQAREYLDTEGWKILSSEAGTRHDDPGEDDR